MGLNRDSLQRQVELAQTDLAHWEQKLDEQGIAPSDRKLNTRWRNLHARCNHLWTRIRATDAVAARDAEARQRKESGVEAAAE